MRALLLVAASLLALGGCGVDVDLGGDDRGSAPEAGTYAGTTSQGLPIAFSVSPGGIGHVSGSFDGSDASGSLSRSRGTAFGVNCSLSGIEWSADPGPTPAMPPPSMGGAPGQSL